MKNNSIHDFCDIYTIFNMATKCLTLFQETRTVNGRTNTRHVGIFRKCKSMESIGYNKSKVKLIQDFI